MVRVDLAKNGRKKIYEVTVARCRVVLWVGCGRWLNASEPLNPHFPSIVDIQCGEKAILL